MAKSTAASTNPDALVGDHSSQPAGPLHDAHDGAADAWHARRSLLRVAAAGALAPLAGRTPAQTGDWPSRPVKLVVPVAPGGIYDATARIVAEKLAGALGQPVIIENKPGAEAKLGTAAVANAPADGYTLLMCGSTIVTGLAVSREVPYKLSQFAPIGLVCWLPIGLGVNAGVPARSLKEFIELAKAKPGALAYGSIAVSTRGIGETFKRAAGIDLTHVAYKGESALTTDLVAGHIASGFMTSGAFRNWYGVEGSKVRWLAVTTPKRMTRFPEVPTFVELGYPQVDLSAWLGVAAPAATPRPIVERLSTVLGEAMATADVRNRVLDLGIEPMHMPAAQFGGFMEREMVRWTRIQKEAGIEIT